MSRLLQDYPADRIAVLASSRYMQVSPNDGRLACRHISFPTLKGWGRWGTGRIKNLINWLMVPVLALVTLQQIKKRKVDVVMTIVHGHFFLAGAFAAWLTHIPYILVVHDDTITQRERQSLFLKYTLRPAVRRVFRGAAHIYAISPEMQQLIKSEFGVDSELQETATERANHAGGAALAGRNSTSILYAGAIGYAVEDSLKTLAELVVSGKLEDLGISPISLHLYTQLSPEKIREWGWDHPSIFVHGWVSQQELRVALQDADILFLPFSFSEAARYAVESAFPSKTADYLAAGKPILVFGPSYSTLVRYATKHGFAETVTESSADALARGIHRIVSDGDYRKHLCERSLEVFEQNHDIVRQRKDLRSLLSRIVAA
jgi:glycosyltransferase involved in cell wall biosynthesis